MYIFSIFLRNNDLKMYTNLNRFEIFGGVNAFLEGITKIQCNHTIAKKQPIINKICEVWQNPKTKFY